MKQNFLKINAQILSKNIHTKKLCKKNENLNNSNILNMLPVKKRNKLIILCGNLSYSKISSLVNIEEYDILASNISTNNIKRVDIFLTINYSNLNKLDIENSIKKIFILNNINSNLSSHNGHFYDHKHGLVYDKLHKFDYILESKSLNNNEFSNDKNNFINGNSSNYSAIQLGLLMDYQEIIIYDLNTNNISDLRIKTNFEKSLSNAKNKFKHINIIHNNEKVKTTDDKNNKINITNNIGNIKSIICNYNNKNRLSDILVVGYFTINTPYEEEAKKTIASCDKFELNYYFAGIENLGDWQKNTRFKAEFMLYVLDEFKDKRLLYIDCDAIIQRVPELFINYTADVAVRFQDFRWRENECLSGTIYMENNERTRELCRIWRDQNNAEGPNAKTMEQWNLGKAMDKMKNNGLIVKNLPPEYTFIFDLMKKLYPNIHPVIIHYQASRRFKNKVSTTQKSITNYNSIPNRKVLFNENNYHIKNIDEKLFNDNELYSNTLKTVAEKEIFFKKLQEESNRKRLEAKSINKPIINMVMSNHWGWVFSSMIKEYQKYAPEFTIIPSINPLMDCDVYQHWRPVYRTSILYFERMKYNIKNNVLRKGIHMIHDSLFDISRANTNYRIKNMDKFKTIVCTSKEQYNYIKSRLSNIDVRYIPLGVSDFIITKDSINSQNKINIGYIGRSYSDGVKNEEKLLTIANAIDNKSFKFTILSPNMDIIINKLKALGFEVITNKDGNFVNLYKNIDVVLITSKYEGTPLPLIESMKYGHTVLSTRVGEVPEHLSSEYIFEQNNVEGFVNALNNINKNRSILEENRLINSEKVKNLTWENHVKQYVQLWKETIKS